MCDPFCLSTPLTNENFIFLSNIFIISASLNSVKRHCIQTDLQNSMTTFFLYTVKNNRHLSNACIHDCTKVFAGKKTLSNCFDQNQYLQQESWNKINKFLLIYLLQMCRALNFLFQTAILLQPGCNHYSQYNSALCRI